jgi:Asp-tRNA(Asn)/Glu-tRNA(Gln) amidotransferase A subunit family amidase
VTFLLALRNSIRPSLLDPNVLVIANEMDVAPSNRNVTGSLWCIPMLLKDNYDSVLLNTTAGCLALRSSIPAVDASTVRELKRAEAIIVGRINLDELVLERLSVFSLGGQAINPYGHSRTLGGSSGATGAAIAVSLAVIGTGTDCKPPPRDQRHTPFRKIKF